MRMPRTFASSHRSFDARVPGTIVVMTVAVAFAIGLIMPPVVGDHVSKGQSIVGREEVHASGARAEHIGGSRYPRRKRGTSNLAVAAPEPPDIVAEAVVPFEPAGRKLTEAIAARTDIPGLGNHYSVAQPGIGLDLGKNRGIGPELRPARKHGCKIKAKAVDSAPANEVSQRL